MNEWGYLFGVMAHEDAPWESPVTEEEYDEETYDPLSLADILRTLCGVRIVEVTA